MGTNPPRPNMLHVIPCYPHSPVTPLRLSDDALESVLVPLDGLDVVDAVGGTDLALAPPALGNTLAGAGHADVEVHAVDTACC